MSRSSNKKAVAVLISAVLALSLSSCSAVSDQTGNTTVSQNALSNLSVSSDNAVSSDTEVSSQNASSEKTSSASSSSVASATPASGSVSDDWNLILVNIDHPLTEELDDNLIDLKVAKVAKGKKFDKRAAPDLYKMFDAAKAAGHNLYSRSTYRTFQLQQTYYDAHVNKYMKQGMTRAQAEQKTEEYTARPKTSEHHTGLAIDITTDEWESAGKGLSTSFENTDACKWLKANAHKYGFILRYPKEKESITKIKYEPWHFRYVGVEHATKIYNQGICLEEYLDFLE